VLQPARRHMRAWTAGSVAFSFNSLFWQGCFPDKKLGVADGGVVVMRGRKEDHASIGNWKLEFN